MNILIWIMIIVGGGIGFLSCLYMVVSLIAMIFYKAYRSIRYHISLYD